METKWVMWKGNIKETTCKDCRERIGRVFDFWELERVPPLHPLGVFATKVLWV